MKEHKKEQNWSLKPIEKKALPKVVNANWPINEIDFFILKDMEKAGFRPEPEADPESLIRRVDLDLNGPVPDMETVEDFKQNPVWKTTKKNSRSLS